MPKQIKKSGSSIIPQIKKKITSFAKGEKGKISRQSMLTVGSIVGGAALGAAIASKITEGFGTKTAENIEGKPAIKVGQQIYCDVDSSTNEILCTHSHHTSY